MTLSDIPIQIWIVLSGYIAAATAMLIRHEVKIPRMEKTNENQNTTISDIYDKVSATREDVAEIKGMLSSRSRDRS